MILVTEEELEAEVGDKFISVATMYEANVYGKGLIQPLLEKLIADNPQHSFGFTGNTPAEPEGIHIRWVPSQMSRIFQLLSTDRSQQNQTSETGSSE